MRCARDVGYPAIIKPPASQSSRGVFLVKDPDELSRLYPKTRAESRDETVLVEEYIDGIEYTVEGYTTGGKSHTLAISDKDHLASNPCIANRLTYPPAADNGLCKKIAAINDRIVEALGLPFGITHAEYKVRDGVPYLMEVAARGGGTFISSSIIPACSGWDVNGMLINELFSIPVETRTVDHRAAILDFMIFDPGIVRSVAGIDRALSLPGVLMVSLDIAPGARLEPPTDDRSRHGFMIVTGETRDEVLSTSRKVREMIRVEVA